MVPPVIHTAGIDLLRFGIFLVVTVEAAHITPPVEFNLFVLQGLTGKPATWIARVCLPYFLLMAAMLVMLWYFPGLVTALPARM